MKFYVMRHGPAEDRAHSGADGDRALTPSGRERVWSVAKLLLELGEEPVHILTSPLVRAVQTAEAVALGTKLGDRDGNVEVRRELSPAGGASGLVAELASDASRKRVMVVGHEPDLSELVSGLLPRGFGRTFDKAMVIGFQLGSSGERARLRFVLDPRALKLDPDHRQQG
jgi:phosphohistidine phosphatase